MTVINSDGDPDQEEEGEGEGGGGGGGSRKCRFCTVGFPEEDEIALEDHEDECINRPVRCPSCK